MRSARKPVYYAPGAVLGLPVGSPAPPGEQVFYIGKNQRNILTRCLLSPSGGTLLRRGDHKLLMAEIQAARGLEKSGLIEMRIFGGTCLGWLWVVVLTELGRTSWLGLRQYTFPRKK